MVNIYSLLNIHRVIMFPEVRAQDSVDYLVNDFLVKYL